STDAQQAARLDLSVAQLSHDLVDLALGRQPLLLGDLVHRAHVEGGAQLAHHHGWQRLIDMQHYYFGAELARQLLGEALSIERVVGKIGGEQDLIEFGHGSQTIRWWRRVGQALDGVDSESRRRLKSDPACDLQDAI